MDRGLSEYERTLGALFERTGATSSFGLERTEAFLALLGDPHKRIRTIHVAGTNGKGSVVATLYALLRAKGLRVGRYTSPHLVDFRERIVVDDRQISEEEVVSFLARWADDTARLAATFFEITTAMAFMHFADMSVDVAVIETGLGGRLDATNVIHPLVTGITSVGIDHTEYLGRTVAAIATEKGGIFKANVPAVCGMVPDAARRSLVRAAELANVSKLQFVADTHAVLDVAVTANGTEFTITDGASTHRLRTGLIGAEQAANACVALFMLRDAGAPFSCTTDEAREILPRVRLAGRFDQIGNLIFDVAHNPDSMHAFVRTLNAVHPQTPVVAILGVLKDKDWRAIMGALAGAVDHIILTAPSSAPPNRAWDLAAAQAFAESRGWSVSANPSLGGAIDRGLAEWKTVVVTGSFHTVGDGLKHIGSLPV